MEDSCCWGVVPAGLHQKAEWSPCTSLMRAEEGCWFSNHFLWLCVCPRRVLMCERHGGSSLSTLRFSTDQQSLCAAIIESAVVVTVCVCNKFERSPTCVKYHCLKLDSCEPCTFANHTEGGVPYGTFSFCVNRLTPYHVMQPDLAHPWRSLRSDHMC